MKKLDQTLGERGSRYGSVDDNAKMTQEIMRVVDKYSKRQLSDVHLECIHMIVHKMARMVNGDQWYEDNAHDIAGYATLLETYIKKLNGKRHEQG